MRHFGTCLIPGEGRRPRRACCSSRIRMWISSKRQRLLKSCLLLYPPNPPPPPPLPPPPFLPPPCCDVEQNGTWGSEVIKEVTVVKCLIVPASSLIIVDYLRTYLSPPPLFRSILSPVLPPSFSITAAERQPGHKRVPGQSSD